MGLFRSRAVFGALSVALGACAVAAPLAGAAAAPSLVMDVASGAVLHQEDATRPWYPASLTKLMTVYVALTAVREGRMTMQTPMVVSNRAARMAPSKMGFKPGTEVTLENALKIIMVKSANDVSVTIAEGVSGSVEAFAAEMNAAARSLGMTQSHFVNPNGLHDAAHVSSARDMAILGRALFLQYPAQQDLYGIGALKLGTKIIPTHNGILGRYPGADGMKTGFVCASGFNVVASANRGGRRLIAVVLGSPNAKARTLKAMSMFEAGFSGSTLGQRQSIMALAPSAYTDPPNLREEVCGRNRNRSTDEDFAIPIAGAPTGQPDGDTSASFFAADRARAPAPALAAFANGDLGPRPTFQPEPIYVGRAPGWVGVSRMAVTDEAPEPVAAAPATSKAARRAAAKAARAEKAAARAAARAAAPKPAVAASAPDKPAAKAKGAARTAGKPVKAAPKADSKTEAKAAAKPADGAAEKTAAKPAPRKAAAKPAAKPAPAKPVGKPLALQSSTATQ